jgi:hypothetical protein
VLAEGSAGDGDAGPDSICPRPDLSAVTTSFNGLVRSEFIAGTGQIWLGWVMPCPRKLKGDFHWTWRCQPQIFGSRGRVPLNVPTLTRPDRAQVRVELLTKLRSRLGKGADRMFPLVVRPSARIKGFRTEWVLSGFVQPDGSAVT